MFLHLGSNTIINTKDILGIFDLDKTSVAKRTREYLAAAEKQGAVVNVSYELPKSFVVCARANKKMNRKFTNEHMLYICQLNTTTLKKRIVNDKRSKEEDNGGKPGTHERTGL